MIQRLSINHLRNIQQLDFQPHSRLNLFYGINGAGKTSVLEAINLVGLGRSFRQRHLKPLIRQGNDQLTVFAQVLASSGYRRLGINKNQRGETDIRIDNQGARSAAQLAQILPVLNINAQSFELIAGPPKPRRQLLDWLTFHVEPLFLESWKALQYALKQRNNLLRHGKIRPSELAPWDLQLTDLTEKVDSCRQRSFNLLEVALQSLGELLPDVGNVTLGYKKGWSSDQGFSDLLAQQRCSDVQRGYTQWGPHRADLTVKADGQAAADTLSRGQTKVVVAAIMIALARAFKDCRGQSCVLLVDDLPSELDEHHRHKVGRWLADLGVQLFVTAVDKGPLETMWPRGFAEASELFHVKQGQLENIDKDLNE